MEDPYFSAKVRVGRAKEHINTLKVEGRAFWESHPYRFIAEANSDGRTKTYKCRLIKPLPDRFHLLAIEAVEHLRSALDHLGYTAAILNGKREPKSAYFPIAESATKLETDVIRRRRCKDLPPDILALFRALEPYKGGKGAATWTLNQLCNSSKHRIITEVSLQSAYANVSQLMLPPGSKILPQDWDSKKNEVSYFSCPISTEPKYDFEVTFYIAFGSIYPVKGQPVVPTLDAIASIITNIVLMTEAESRRVGLTS